MRLPILLLSLFATSAVFSQSPTADSTFLRRLSNETLTRSTAYENLRVLTKSIGGRLAGSPGMVKAEAWGVKAFEAAGALKVWKQECMVPHWVRGGRDEATAVTMGKKSITRKLDVVALGNTIGSGKPLTAALVLVNSFADLERMRDSVRGKIVFYNYPFDPRFVRTFEAYGDAGAYRRSGPSRAARYGAAAVIVRSLSSSTDNHPHTGSTVYNDSFAKIPAVAIGLRDADWLAAQLQKRIPVTVSLTTRGRFLPDTVGHNIIAEIPGTGNGDEYITLGGHLDSWDNCEGAHDDGAGCVQTIEVLRAFLATGYKPRRTIRFVLWANEENGVRGGNKYAEEAKRKGEKQIFALESDAGGFTPRGFGFTLSDAQWNRIRGWAPLLQPYGAADWSRGGGGTDIAPLNHLLGTPLAGLQPDSQRYFDYHHARSDTFEAVNKRELELGAVAMAALIYLVDQYGFQ